MKESNESLTTILYGKKGSLTSVKIIDLLFEKPLNVNQISNALNIHYNTSLYHVKLLTRGNILEKEGGGYGALYMPTKHLNDNIHMYKKLKKDLLDDMEKEKNEK